MLAGRALGVASDWRAAVLGRRGSWRGSPGRSPSRPRRDIFLCMPLPERKRPVHWPLAERHNRSIIIFLTVCTKGRRPILAEERVHAALVAAWAAADHWRIGRYVLLPDHVHLFCAPWDWPPPPLKTWVTYWKRLVTKETGLRGIWQEGFWDTQLRHHESYGAKWDYVQQNPVRHDLVLNASAWPYQGEIEVLYWHD